MEPSEVLMEAAKLVRKGWCQGAYARDRFGKEVPEVSGEAVSWCAIGAVCCVARENYSVQAKALDRLIYVLGTVSTFNDAPGRTAEEVALKLEEAAELARRNRG